MAGTLPVLGSGATYGAYLTDRAYVVISGLTFSGTAIDGIYVSGSDHVTISGNTVTGAGQPRQGATAPGISLRSSTASTVSGNTSDHNSSHGILVSGSSTGNVVAGNEASWNAEGWRRNANGIDVISPANTVLRNVVHDNEDSGLQFYPGANDSLAMLNVTYNNGDHGIDNLNATGGRLIGNTVYRNCTSGINIEGTSGSYLVANNVAVDNAVYPAYNGIACSRRAGNIGVFDSATSSTVVDHNLVWLSKSGTMYAFGSSYTSLQAMRNATGQEAAGVQADPGFVDRGAYNLAISAGSAAIDRGDSGLADAPSQDTLGNPRVDDPATANTFASGPRLYDDLGAYEFQPGPPPNTAPTARLSASPTSGTAPVTVTADAAASTDPQGQALSYRFDYGDGAGTGNQSSATSTHTYTAAGTYTLTVTATDTGGLSSSASRTITVTAPASAPTARLAVTPSSGTAPVQVTADASASTDPQGQTLTYRFDYGDGTSSGNQSSATSTHTYTAAGTYTLTVTATDTSGLSSTASRTITVTAPASAPTARLVVTPSSGTAPVQVTADASTSTDPQGQTLTYRFDYGDGTSSGNQSSATSTHTYTAAGTYTLTVTATDTSGLSSTASRTVSVTAAPPPPSGAPKFVAGIANNYSTSTRTSGYLTVWRPGGVTTGDLAVLTLQLSGTSATAPVSATDAAGNAYAVVADVSDTAGNRLLLISGVITTPLAVNDRITVTFPSSRGYRLGGDEFSGASRLDRTSTSTGTAATFSSNAAAATVGQELAFGAVSVPSGTGNPTWTGGWSDLGSYANGTSYLGRAYRLPVSGSATATGTATGAWLAAVVTLTP